MAQRTKSGAATEDRLFDRSLLLLYESANLRALPERILESVRPLIPGEVLSVADIDWISGRVTTYIDPEDFFQVGFTTLEEANLVLARYLPEHPIAREFLTTGSSNAQKISDHLSHPAWRETAIYREFYGRLRTEDQLAYVFPVHSGCSIAVTSARSRRTFRTQHLERMNRLGPHLIQAYRNAQQVTRLEDWRSGEAQGIAAAEALGLGRRQTEVLCAIARGMSNAQAAAELGVSPLTLKKHLENIYLVLGVGSRSAAVARLLEQMGWMPSTSGAAPPSGKS